MKRKIVFSLAAFFLALGVISLVYRYLSSTGNAGYVIIGLGDWALETSLYFVVIFLTVLFLLSYFGIRFMTGAAKLPDSIRKRNSEQRSRRSVDALLSGFVETLEGKSEKAERSLIMHAADSAVPLINYLTAAQAAHDRNAPEQRDDYLKLATKALPQAELAAGLTRARLLIESQQYVEALEQLNDMNRAHSNHPVVLRLMFEAYIGSRDWDALHHLMPIVREAKAVPEPELRKTEIDVYRVLLEKRAVTHDAKLIREIWRLVPPGVRAETSVTLPYCRGMIDAGVGEEVEEDVRLALGREWDHDLLALYERIQLADPGKQLLGAEDWLGPHRDDPYLLNALARFALRAGRLEKAIGYSRASLELKPTAAACRLLGDVLFESRDFVTASAVYRQGLKAASDEPVDQAELEQATRLFSQPMTPVPPGNA